MPADERGNPTRVLLGVTGGIAAYKAPELVRRLVERGCEVQVVMTAGAERFVTPLTFEAVSGRRVRDDLWDPSAEASMAHIELARWADVVVVAPATAHFMAELAAGLAGDLLTTLCLATTAPIVLAPAMNQAMWANAAVQANRQLLEARGVRLLGPAEGDQACGEVGAGRMVEPLEIAAALLETPARLRLQPLAGLRVLITAGPTREPIDPVRYITNRSSGKMGYALASAAREAGAEVVLVSGPVALPAPAGVRRVDVETADELYAKVHEEIAGVDIFVGCAAVSDYRPLKAATQKIKRSAEEMELALVRSPDTLASVAKLKSPPFTVGFAAETQDVARYAREKLDKKRIDMIAANQVGRDCGFDRETNALTVFWPGGELALGEGSKPVLARRLVELIAERYRAARRGAQPTSRAG
ncbi:MAG TPA: bifunctional phosphopantothenoylcysteine decarboxylase/phosphopantothenate--cysteine ligase CoaBC [Gammaproteobacteria bacterium]|nr:bifunctional phosphopantothenoylcysteine decarboxylase/phosphopantothenate--cysteine ligase CoaBC [Gammaproteobacteria bacterium]